MPHTIFRQKKKNNNNNNKQPDFQLIDQALKPRPCRLFSSQPFVSESSLSTCNVFTDLTQTVNNTFERNPTYKQER